MLPIKIPVTASLYMSMTSPEGFKDTWDKLEGAGWKIIDVRKINDGKLIELIGIRRRPSKGYA